MSAFDAFLRGALGRMAQRRRTGLPDALLAPWLELAARAGAVPKRGPLTHDLLLPAPRPQAAFGLNLFPTGDGTGDGALFRQIAHSWARRWLGPCHELERALALEPAPRFAGGFAVSDDELRLKLYASERLTALAELLGLGSDGALALGFDVTSRGIARPRRYYAGPSLGPARDWIDAPASTSHRLLTVLEGAHAKRTHSTIFRADAGAREVVAIAEELDHELVGELEALAIAHALELRAVAHEVDFFADGTRRTDVILAAGVRSPPSSS